MKSLLLSFLLSSSLLAWDSCTYTSVKDDMMMEIFKDCIDIDKNQNITINKKHLDNMFFDENALACVGAKKSLFFVNKNAKALKTVSFDNGCDTFSQELARVKINNKTSYINKNFDIQIKTDYFYGSRFYKNRAIVCDETIKKIYKQEHSFYSGGSCNILNTKGKLLLETELSYEEVLQLLKKEKI